MSVNRPPPPGHGAPKRPPPPSFSPKKPPVAGHEASMLKEAKGVIKDGAKIISRTVFSLKWFTGTSRHEEKTIPNKISKAEKEMWGEKDTSFDDPVKDVDWAETRQTLDTVAPGSRQERVFRRLFQTSLGTSKQAPSQRKERTPRTPRGKEIREQRQPSKPKKPDRTEQD